MLSDIQRLFERAWEVVATEESWVSPISQHYLNPQTRVDVFHYHDFVGLAYGMGLVRKIQGYKDGDRWQVTVAINPDNTISTNLNGISPEEFKNHVNARF